MKVLAVDPGVTSGYVIGKLDDGIADPFERIEDVTIVAAGEWSGMPHLLQKEMIFEGIDMCVVERYVIYPNRAHAHVGDDLYTAREIGRIEWLAWNAGVEVTFQAASQAKQRWPDRRLYTRYPGARNLSLHIRDATRHLLTYVEVSL